MCWKPSNFGSRGGRFTLAFVCLFIIAKTDAARIIKLDTEMYHHESRKGIYFGVKRSKIKVTRHKKVCQCRPGFLHSCECWLLLVLIYSFVYMHICIVRSCKRDAMEKMKIANGVATDVYLSHSRCVRNNDKPADNNVFTGLLPVSAGPQHHQWQQQHQQLLMQANDNVEFFAESGHSAWSFDESCVS